MPFNLPTLKYLLGEQRRDFGKLIRHSTPTEEKQEARQRYMGRRRKMLQLVEELSLRTRRVLPLVDKLEELSKKMDRMQQHLQLLKTEGATAARMEPARRELQAIDGADIGIAFELATSLRAIA